VTGKALRGLLLAFAVLTVPARAHAQPARTHALVGVTVFGGTAADRENQTIVIESGRIADVFPTGSRALPDSIPQIALSGHVVTPGLIDSHVHLGQLQLSNSPEASRREFRRWIYAGVTSVRDMGGDARALAVEDGRNRSNVQPGPEIYWSATVASPDMAAKDMRLRATTQGIGVDSAGYVIVARPDADVVQQVQRAVASGATGLKFYAGVPLARIQALAGEAKRQGLRTWAHLTVFPDRPLKVIRAGVEGVSHVWGAFWQDPDVDPSAKVPFTDTDFAGARTAVFPEDVRVLNADGPEVTELFAEMARRGVIWDMTYRVADSQAQQLYRPFALAGKQAGVAFSTGTDYHLPPSEPFPSVYREMYQLVDDGIASPREVIVASTWNGAKAIGIEATHGSIEVGKVANLVVFARNPAVDIRNLESIVLTVRDGVLFQRSEY
jgi:imidazolonepropionase-like amidohydrolase